MAQRLLSIGTLGDDVAALHESLAQHGLTIPESEAGRSFFGPATRQAVLAFQDRKQLKATGQVDATTAAALLTKPDDARSVVVTRQSAGLLTSDGPQSSSVTGAAGRLVEGRLLRDDGLPTAGVRLRLYNREFGGVETRLNEVETNSDGLYSLPYDPAGKPANVEVRAVDAQGNEIPLSVTKLNAESREVLNLVAPASILAPDTPEYQRLATDLTARVGQLSELAKARETSEVSDLAMLHEATGWDARLIAFAATANKLSAQIKTDAKIDVPEDGLYALLRVGLPSDQQELAGVSPATVERALRKASDNGVVNFSEQKIGEVKAAFETFSRETRLAVRAPGASSTYRELLESSGLASPEKQTTFATLYLDHRGSGPELWQKALNAGLTDGDVKLLQRQGKLAYLTHNNNGLVASLEADLGDSHDLAQLVAMDLHTPEAWKTRLQSAAGGDQTKLTALIPPAFTGVDAYAAELGRRVEASYPTHVVARMIAKDNVLGDEFDGGAVSEFLMKAATLHIEGTTTRRFELGEIGIDTFVNQYGGHLFQPDTPKETIAKTTRAVKIVQRVYQFTPSNSAMKVLLSQGLTSANDVTTLSKQDFLDRYGKSFLSMQDAESVYDKAAQVSSVVHSVAAIARQIGRSAQPFSISGPDDQRDAASRKLREELLKHYPTMESLFGALDFCECEHCQSVLSPAAYFVDLLAFVDPDETVWEGFTNDWKAKHNGLAYTDRYKKPFDALVERRPDLPHLALTCENTNTALPYIDLVNEILEYYVANAGRLDAQAAHDTGEATTPELLAEPQNMVPQAYEVLRGARYPLGLPFDVWLETVRRFVDQFDMPLWRLLEIFRPSDDLLPPATDAKSYYRAQIFAEYLGIAPGELDMFTDPSALGNWQSLYGFEDSTTTVAQNQAEALASLTFAKSLSRRLGVTYKEVVDVVLTGFVNPSLWGLEALQRLSDRLGLSAEDLFRYKGRSGYQAFTSEEAARFEMQLTDVAVVIGVTLAEVESWIDQAWQNVNFGQILLFADPDTSSSLESTSLQYADGTAADDLAFLRINLFVRLWKKLGWTVEETDRALQVFVPGNLLPLTKDNPDAGANLAAALRTALIYIAHLSNLGERVTAGKSGRLKLLALWSDLPTTGKTPLYAQLFLTRSVLKDDKVFDHPVSAYLSTPGVLVRDHLAGVRGALNLTADEVERILADRGASLVSAELSLATASTLYRYGLMAKVLKISVRDLIALKSLAGLDPFMPLSRDPIATIADDYPFSQTIRFVEIASAVRDSGSACRNALGLKCSTSRCPAWPAKRSMAPTMDIRERK